ncbi:unnamed protein product [Closterium sp. Yama58-4]|nr:unnamed protein product [Closterium sp. Yama58-4]
MKKLLSVPPLVAVIAALIAVRCAAEVPPAAVIFGMESDLEHAMSLYRAWERAYDLAEGTIRPPAKISLPPNVPPLPHLEDCAARTAFREATEKRAASGELPKWSTSSEACGWVPQPPWIRGSDAGNLAATWRAQRDLWEWQFPASCRERRLVLIEWSPLERHGLGSQVHIMTALFSLAVSYNRTFVPMPDSYMRANHSECQALGKASTFECYFFPMVSRECEDMAMAEHKAGRIPPCADFRGLEGALRSDSPVVCANDDDYNFLRLRSDAARCARLGGCCKRVATHIQGTQLVVCARQEGRDDNFSVCDEEAGESMMGTSPKVHGAHLLGRPRGSSRQADRLAAMARAVLSSPPFPPPFLPPFPPPFLLPFPPFYLPPFPSPFLPLFPPPFLPPFPLPFSLLFPLPLSLLFPLPFSLLLPLLSSLLLDPFTVPFRLPFPLPFSPFPSHFLSPSPGLAAPPVSPPPRELHRTTRTDNGGEAYNFFIPLTTTPLSLSRLNTFPGPLPLASPLPFLLPMPVTVSVFPWQGVGRRVPAAAQRSGAHRLHAARQPRAAPSGLAVSCPQVGCVMAAGGVCHGRRPPYSLLSRLEGHLLPFPPLISPTSPLLPTPRTPGALVASPGDPFHAALAVGIHVPFHQPRAAQCDAYGQQVAIHMAKAAVEQDAIIKALKPDDAHKGLAINYGQEINTLSHMNFSAPNLENEVWPGLDYAGCSLDNHTDPEAPKHAADSVYEGVGGEPYIPRPSVSMHVRQGDKAGEMRLISFPSFMFMANRLRRRVPFLKYVWLSTEMQSVIDQSQQYKDWAFLYSTNPRQNGTTSIFEYEQTAGVAKLAGISLANLLISSQADFFVGALGSNWNRLISELKATSGRLYAGYASVNFDKW